jgi:hypothetical protein
MLSLAVSFLLINPPQKWSSGDLTVEVNKDANSWRVLLPDSTIVYQASGIDAISYVLVKDKELTMTGTKEGRTFFTKFAPKNRTTIHVETSFISTQSQPANHLQEEFSIPGATLSSKSQTGLAPTWKTPFLLYSSEKFSTAVWPDLNNFNLTTPMPATLESGKIGYQNANPTQAGAFEKNNVNRPVPSSAQFSFYIQAQSNPLTASEIATQIWNQQTNRFRAQAFPQQTPMSTSAEVTYKFKKQAIDTYFGLFDINQITSDMRWETLGESEEGKEKLGGEEEEEGGGIEDLPGAMGVPKGQNDTIQLNSSVNAMRAATSMYSWGVYKDQGGWIAAAKQLMTLIVAGSPENGFATKIQLIDEQVTEPKEFDFPATADEAATAFFAVQILAEFPDNPLAEPLTERIEGVLKRLPNSAPTPEMAALIATCSKQQTLPDDIRQIAVENLVQTQATFAITPENKSNPWTLEAFYWLRKINTNLYDQQITELAQNFSLAQNLTDNRDQDQLAIFGAFRTQSGEMSTETPQIASILGRTAILMNNPEWLDRAAFALRSMHISFETSLGSIVPEIFPGVTWGTSLPGFGNVQPNRPDPRKNFEASEGLLNAATWELLHESGGAYTFPNGTTIGIDGLASSSDNIVRNTLFGNPVPFSGVLQEGIKANGAIDKQTVLDAPGMPAIASIYIEPRDNEFYVVANPNLSLTRVPGQSKGSFTIAGRKIPAVLGSAGFEAKLPALNSPTTINFSGQIGDTLLSKSTSLAQGSPMLLATDFSTWYRSADYRWSGTSSIVQKGQTWLSTGDLGNGSEAQWMTGLIYTPWLTATGKTLEFTASGDGDCRIILVDSDIDVPVETWFPQGNNESKVKFDLSSLRGRRIKLIIQDRDEKGLIRVTNLKVTD